MHTNNSSKELINNIKQLINNLYNNKQITKQVYNILNKAINYGQSTKAKNVQYDVNRRNAEISAYSSGDLDKYELFN